MNEQLRLFFLDGLKRRRPYAKRLLEHFRWLLTGKPDDSLEKTAIKMADVVERNASEIDDINDLFRDEKVLDSLQEEDPKQRLVTLVARLGDGDLSQSEEEELDALTEGVVVLEDDFEGSMQIGGYDVIIDHPLRADTSACLVLGYFNGLWPDTHITKDDIDIFIHKDVWVSNYVDKFGVTSVVTDNFVHVIPRDYELTVSFSQESEWVAKREGEIRSILASNGGFL